MLCNPRQKLCGNVPCNIVTPDLVEGIFRIVGELLIGNRGRGL